LEKVHERKLFPEVTRQLALYYLKRLTQRVGGIFSELFDLILLMEISL